MPITHEHARKLIQWRLDRMLNAQESAALSAHLHDCRDCATYASEIKKIVSILPPLLKRQWNIQPIPLSFAALTSRNEKTKSSNLLAMRTAAMGLMMMLFFSIWQFMVYGTPETSRVSAAIPPVPTPSSLTAQSTGTQFTLEGCTMKPYTVQENDTLARIADQFSISEDTILKVNKLETDMVRPPMELVIPVCPFTSTGTFYPATFTTTYTPFLNYTLSTPGG